MTGIVYRDPETGGRKLLGGGDIPRQARDLEADGWVLVRPAGFDPHPPARDDFVSLDGISDEIAAALNGADLWSFDDLRAASDEALLAISGIGAGRLQTIRGGLAQCESLQPES